MTRYDRFPEVGAMRTLAIAMVVLLAACESGAPPAADDGGVVEPVYDAGPATHERCAFECQSSARPACLDRDPATGEIMPRCVGCEPVCGWDALGQIWSEAEVRCDEAGANCVCTGDYQSFVPKCGRPL